MDRALRFYNQVFDYQLEVNLAGELEMAWFPFDPDKSGSPGALVYNEDWYVPDDKKGPLLYCTTDDIDVTLKRVSNSGGNIILAKTLISETVGYMAVFTDSEGNRIALYTRVK